MWSEVTARLFLALTMPACLAQQGRIACAALAAYPSASKNVLVLGMTVRWTALHVLCRVVRDVWKCCFRMAMYASGWLRLSFRTKGPCVTAGTPGTRRALSFAPFYLVSCFFTCSWSFIHVGSHHRCLVRSLDSQWSLHFHSWRGWAVYSLAVQPSCVVCFFTTQHLWR